MELRDRLLLFGVYIKGLPFTASTLHAPSSHHYHVVGRKPNRTQQLSPSKGNTQKIDLQPGQTSTFTVSNVDTIFEAREYREQLFPHHDPGLVVMGGGKKITLGPHSAEMDDPIIGNLKFIAPVKNGITKK